VLRGNCREVLQTIEPESVQCCVTSPPYFGLRLYEGNQACVWGGEIGCQHEFEELEPISCGSGKLGDKSGLGGGQRTQEEFRFYGIKHGFCRLCGAWFGNYGNEPTLAQYIANTVMIFREVRRVLRDNGVLFLNVGDSFFGDSPVRGKASEQFDRMHNSVLKRSAGGTRRSAVREGGLKPKDLMMVPARIAIALQDDGWYLRQDIIWQKTNPMPSSVKDRPATSHEHIFLLSKSRNYYFDSVAIMEPSTAAGMARATRNWHGTEVDGRAVKTMGTCGEMRNSRSVWTFATKGYPGAHFACFPPELPRRCIMAGSKAGDTVLDPFAGSGTTLAVAKELGRDYIGIELSEDYLPLIDERLAKTVRQTELVTA
jgi:DNA modification methylase